MPVITLYEKFSKKINSTKRPSDGINISVELKDDISRENPTFILSNINWNYTYAKWDDNYYYITDIISLDGRRSEITCKQDLLATFKNEIGNYNAYVERSSNEYDIYLNDVSLSVEQKIDYIYHKSFLIDTLSDTGCYILRTVGGVGEAPTSATGINTYAISKETLANVLNYSFNFDNFQEFQDEVIKAVFNPFDYIVDIKYVPLDIMDISEDQIGHDIKLGYWVAGTGHIVTKSSITFDITLHLDDLRYNDFRRFNPNYTICKLFLPGMGMIDISPLELNYPSMRFIYVMDIATGDTDIYIYSGKDQLITLVQGSLCAQIQLAQSSMNLAKATGDIAGAVASGVAGNYVVAGLSAIDAISNIVSPTPAINGKNASISFLKSNKHIHLYIFQMGCGDFATATNGRPLMKNRQLKNIPGYIKCGGASIDIPSFPNEKEEINNFLNNGFYYE